MHKSAGVIIKNSKGEILMHERPYFPPGWACAAGHIDHGETPEQAAIREAKEETGLEISKLKLLFHEFVEWNDCVSGGQGHDWYVFEILDWKGEVKACERETKNMKWVKPDEIKNLELEEVWAYWFKKINIIS